MAESPNQPILVRDDTVVLTAVGVSEPSLTLVEFQRGVGFLLAVGFQADSFGARYYLEKVILWRTGDLLSESERHPLVLLGDGSGSPDTEAVTANELEILTAHWLPAVFFLTVTEHAHLLVRLEEHDPERILREAFNRAHGTEALRSRVVKLKARWEEELRGLHILEKRVQPKRETIRISLPPKPGSKEYTKTELAKLSSEERAEVKRWLDKLMPPEDPPPSK